MRILTLIFSLKNYSAKILFYLYFSVETYGFVNWNSSVDKEICQGQECLAGAEICVCSLTFWLALESIKHSVC